MYYVMKNVLYEYVAKKDIYVLFFIMVLVIFLTGYLTVFNLDTEAKILKDIPLFFMPVFSLFVGIITIFSQLDKEIKNRTLTPLLAKPITKAEFLTGKFLGALCITLIFLYTVALFYWVFLMIRGLSLDIVFIHYLVLLTVRLFMVISFTLLLSVFMTPAAAFSISFLFFLISDEIPHTLNEIIQLPDLNPLSQVVLRSVYLVIPHTDIFDISRAVIHGWEPVPSHLIIPMIAYGLVYSAFFLFLATFIFHKKEF